MVIVLKIIVVGTNVGLVDKLLSHLSARFPEIDVLVFCSPHEAMLFLGTGGTNDVVLTIDDPPEFDGLLFCSQISLFCHNKPVVLVTSLFSFDVTKADRRQMIDLVVRNRGDEYQVQAEVESFVLGRLLLMPSLS